MYVCPHPAGETDTSPQFVCESAYWQVWFLRVVFLLQMLYILIVYLFICKDEYLFFFHVAFSVTVSEKQSCHKRRSDAYDCILCWLRQMREIYFIYKKIFYSKNLKVLKYLIFQINQIISKKGWLHGTGNLPDLWQNF